VERKIYQENVKEASKLYKQVLANDGELFRIKKQIAKLALEVCDIRHGGMSGNKYTLTRFADDTGISRKTISDWVRVFRLSKVLGVDIKSDESWRKVDYVDRKRALMITSKNHQNDTIKAKARIDNLQVEEVVALKKVYNGAANAPKGKKSEELQRSRGLILLVKLFQQKLKSVAFLRKNDLSMAELLHLKKLLEQTKSHIERAIEIEK
jgi:hypothetical protein